MTDIQDVSTINNMEINQKNYDLIVEAYADKVIDHAQSAESDPTSQAFKAEIAESINHLYSPGEEANELRLLADFTDVTPFDRKPQPSMKQQLAIAAAKGLYHGEPDMANYEPRFGNIQNMVIQLGVMAFEQDVQRKAREKAKRLREQYEAQKETEDA